MQTSQTYTLARAPAPRARHNISSTERLSSATTGGLLLAFGVSRRSAAGAVLTLAGTALLARGASGHCPVYDTLGVTTARHPAIAVHDAIRVQALVEDVYRFWRQLDTLPAFMRHIERVDDLGNGRSHWVARGPAGLAFEWDAEIVHEVENALLTWRSLPGGDVATSGAVRFDPIRRGSSTQVTVALQYDPPAGRLGRSFAALVGREPSGTLREDLRRLKQLLETGEVPRAHVEEPRAMSRTEVGR